MVVLEKGDVKMAQCELLAGCSFFHDKMAKVPKTAELMKNRLCRGNKRECARYMVCKALGRDKVPPDLFPNQTDRANTIITEI